MGIIRFLLALAVVAFHSQRILGLRLMGGNEAVEIFFIISGFYMSLILRGKYARHAHAAARVRSFLKFCLRGAYLKRKGGGNGPSAGLKDLVRLILSQ